MSKKNLINWYEANQQYLMAAIKTVRVELERYKNSCNKINNFNYDEYSAQAWKELNMANKKMPAPAALDILCSTFGLSSFERNLLLLATGIELDSEFETLVSSIQGEKNYFNPTFSLALAALPEAHWNAITPNSPLRYWRLIEVIHKQSITKSTFSIDEQILNYIVGLPQINETLSGITDIYLKQIEPVPSQNELANHILNILSGSDNNNFLPVIQLSGNDLHDKLHIASKVCRVSELLLYTMSVYSIPDTIKDITELTRLWNREAYLGSTALFLECSDVDTNDNTRLQKIIKFCQNINGLLFLGCQHWSPVLNRQKYVFNVNKPTTEEQFILWQQQLGIDAVKLDGELSRIVSQFNLSTQSIYETTDIIRKNKKLNLSKDKNLEQIIWKECCKQCRPRLDDLAQRIEPAADWEDIVLPEFQKQTLLEITFHVKQRIKVYEEWGFANKNTRGLGISVLFTGESGTGKTMASEILAKELQLDLYRIDLSQVVNKYIGETEKNLKKVFDAAEAGGAVLLFDEADALFGKRSEVKDSHDRYANIEVSYLLQRMEAYRGLAILTTNLKSAMDKAFLRRIRFIVQFPFPDEEQRGEIWRKMFPPAAPIENIDVKKLAKLNITGGNIRNIALNAAFIAAETNSAIKMEHIERASRYEYTKLEKPMSTIENSTW